MTFQGEVLSVGTLLARAKAAPDSVPASRVGVRNTAAANALHCADLIAAGSSLDECWRFGILQTLDDYTSHVRRGGTTLGAQVFAEEPQRTGAEEIDAAFAALADHLADRDGWPAPAWVADPTRRTSRWYPAVPAVFRMEAEKESPTAFAERGILITARSLLRA